MAGGDGSQAAVAAIAAEHDVAFVCVPVGTRMDFARDLGLDIEDPAKSLDAFGESLERRIDLGRVNDQVFVNNVSLGVYGSIVQSPEYRDAKLKTTADMLPALLGEGTLSKLAFTGPDGSEHAGAQIIQVSNNPYQLESLAGFASRARLDSGTRVYSPPRSTVRRRRSSSRRSSWPDGSAASPAGCSGRPLTSRCDRTGR